MKVKLANENYTENYLKNLLIARGVKNVEEYINPDINCLNDPILLDNINEGVTLLESVLNK